MLKNGRGYANVEINFSTGIGRREFSMLDYIEYANVIFYKRAECKQDFEILSP